MESFRLLQFGANTYQLITIKGKDIFAESRNQSNAKTYLPVFRLTSMRFLMWARSSTACTSVYPEWIASNSASCMKTYCCSTWTMRFLSRRKDVTYPNTSTVFSTAILCNMASTTIKVPVLPTPALQWMTCKKKECLQSYSCHSNFFWHGVCSTFWRGCRLCCVCNVVCLECDKTFIVNVKKRCLIH